MSEAFSYLAPPAAHASRALPPGPLVSVRTGADLRRPETQLKLLRGRARAAVLEAEEAVERGTGGGRGPGRGGGAAAEAREAMVGGAVELGR